VVVCLVAVFGLVPSALALAFGVDLLENNPNIPVLPPNKAARCGAPHDDGELPAAVEDKRVNDVAQVRNPDTLTYIIFLFPTDILFIDGPMSIGQRVSLCAVQSGLPGLTNSQERLSFVHTHIYILRRQYLLYLSTYIYIRLYP
jgi:hypothetical protein